MLLKRYYIITVNKHDDDNNNRAGFKLGWALFDKNAGPPLLESCNEVIVLAMCGQENGCIPSSSFYTLTLHCFFFFFLIFLFLSTQLRESGRAL